MRPRPWVFSTRLALALLRARCSQSPKSGREWRGAAGNGNAVGEGRSGASAAAAGPSRSPPSPAGGSSAPGPGQGVAGAQSARHRRRSPASQRGRAPLGWGCKPGGGEAGLGVDLGQEEPQPRVALEGDGIPADVQRRRDSPRLSGREGRRKGGTKGAAVAPPHAGILREVRGELGWSAAPGSSPRPRALQPVGRGEEKRGAGAGVIALSSP